MERVPKAIAAIGSASGAHIRCQQPAVPTIRQGLVSGDEKEKVQSSTHCILPDDDDDDRSSLISASADNRPSLVLVLLKLYLPYFSISTMLYFVFAVCQLLVPELMRMLLETLPNPMEPNWKCEEAIATVYCLVSPGSNIPLFVRFGTWHTSQAMLSGLASLHR